MSSDRRTVLELIEQTVPGVHRAWIEREYEPDASHSKILVIQVVFDPTGFGGAPITSIAQDCRRVWYEHTPMRIEKVRVVPRIKSA